MEDGATGVTPSRGAAPHVKRKLRRLDAVSPTTPDEPSHRAVHPISSSRRHLVKFAVTVMSPFSGTCSTQVMPLQLPLNPVNVEPAAAIGISESVEPTGKMARQMPPLMPLAMLHARPPGELETDPLPAPAPAFTVTEPGTASRYNACTERDCASGSVQLLVDPAAAHAPSQDTKTLPAVGDCVRVTLVFSAYAFTQVPLVAMYVSAQEIPTGALVMVPPPSEPETVAMVSVGGAANCAVTLVIAPVTIVTLHVGPLHAPVKPENELMPDGVDVSVTSVFGGNVVEQVPPTTPAVITQLIPEGELVTVPVPDPPPLTVTPCVLKITSAVRDCVAAT